MVAIRKKLAGADSYGHVWDKDGAVVDVDPEQAVSLLAIPDGGFSEAGDITEPGRGDTFAEVEQPGDVTEHDDDQPGDGDESDEESDDDAGKDSHTPARKTTPRRKRSV